MENHVRREIQRDLEGFYLPKMRDIPDVGLLLEQTCRLVNGYLSALGSIRLTPSMISNYVKQGIIDRPIKKLYYREQVADLIFIAVAKKVLQLDDIKRMLELQREHYEPGHAYAYFATRLERAVGAVCDTDKLDATGVVADGAAGSMADIVLDHVPSQAVLSPDAQDSDSDSQGDDNVARELLARLVICCAEQIYLEKYVRLALPVRSEHDESANGAKGET